MSVETRQFQEMVRVAYFQLKQKQKPCNWGFDAEEAERHGFRCPDCGGELVETKTLGAAFYVHKKLGN